ncbi:mitochondrial amidoxime reducing component 2-like [Episyrphus balteatus]|uniref:mitochondrial amidoxime reducing component 2-like n=1 Tax=Episyrphus balteatus TaxID=286459 RepID=UPI002486C518|nr:mitochondrial amidoxime reducing component 2-like [Episyrphus balteatus]
MTNSRILTSIGIGVGVSVLSALSYFYYKRSKKEVIPTKWKKVGIIDKLYFIPIKSCGPIELDEAVCENLGVRKDDIKDRALMVIEENGQVITARTYPQMFKIIPKILSRSELLLTAPGMEDLRFDYSTLDTSSKTSYIKGFLYGFYADVLECGEVYNKWFSEYILGKPEGLRLVYYPHEIATRPIGRFYKEGIYTKQDTGTFQDMSSYHLINNVSVDDLNTRLNPTDKVPLLQFRANFYIKNTGQAYDEDHWQWVKIGNEVVFRNIGPCYRCIVPNVNPYTSERHPNGEPLKTLKKYRVIPGSKFDSPGMGIQLGLRVGGNVKQGDSVYAQISS